MKKRILVSGFGILIIIAIVVTAVAIQRAFNHPTKTAPLSTKGKHSPTPCPSTGQGICQGQILVLSHEPGTPSPTPTQAPPPTPTPNANGGGGNSIEKQLFNQINSDRAAQGLPPYTWNSTLAGTAYNHNVVMASGCGLYHQCSGEPTPCQRFKTAGITQPACGENIDIVTLPAYSDKWTAIYQHTEVGELAERAPNDGHRQNLLSPISCHNQVGVSIYTDTQGTAWVSEDFTGAYVNCPPI